MKKDLLDSIKKSFAGASTPCAQEEFVLRYLGTKRRFLNVKSSERDKILRQVTKQIKNLEKGEILELLNSLILSDTFEYLNFAGKLLAISPEARGLVSFVLLRKWLKSTTGWAECDSVCQSLFTKEEVLKNWGVWRENIMKFANSKNIQLRRASLVLQVKSVRESEDERLLALALDTIEGLKGEREVLITKAVSWLLRALAVRNGPKVLKYLKANQDSLPKIAYRETMKKIKTGRK